MLDQSHSSKGLSRLVLPEVVGRQEFLPRVVGRIQHPRAACFWRTGRSFLSVLFLLGAVAAPGWAQDSIEPEEEQPPKHRFSLGAQWFDGSEGDSTTGSLTYSWVPHPHHGLAATMLLVGSDVPGANGSGIGDTRIQYSWVPSANITAAAWVPTTLGLGFGLIVPTGDPAKGTGVDRWVAIPTLGWVFTLGERFALQPSLQYLYSFNDELPEEHISSANLVLTFLYVANSGFWIDLTADLFRDFEPVETTNEDWFLTFGQQFTRVFGASLTLGSIERPPVQNPEFERSSDEFIELTAHFVLPWGRGGN
jgi:hypothetical protein